MDELLEATAASGDPPASDPSSSSNSSDARGRRNRRPESSTAAAESNNNSSSDSNGNERKRRRAVAGSGSVAVVAASESDEEEEDEEEGEGGSAAASVSVRVPRKRKAEDAHASPSSEESATAVMAAQEEEEDGNESHGSAAEDTTTTTTSTTSTTRAKRVRKSADEKCAILQFVADGGTHGAAADKFGVSRTAVTKMVKERDVILERATIASPLPVVEGPPSVPLDTGTLAGITGIPVSSTPTIVSVDPTSATMVTLTPTGTSSALKRERERERERERAALSPPLLPASGGRKGKRVRKTNVEKLEILAFVEQGGSQGAAAEKFGVSRTAVTKMVKEKAAISAQATSGSNTTHRKVLQYQHKLSIIEDMLYKWQVQVEFEAPSLKVTGELLQSKAMEFRNKILNDFSADLPDDVVVSLTDFKASNGWLHRYTQRRNVRSLSKHEHHSVAADPSHVDKRMETIRKQLALARVPLQCIWNFDEAVLRHRTTAVRADAAVNLDPRSQERLTVTLCVSAAGEKLMLQAIGAASEPASLKAVDDPVAAFGVSYHGQRKACQDSSTIMHFVNLMNQEARSRKQVWYILLDNCPSHMAAASILDPSGTYDSSFKVDAVVLLVLPPSSVGSLQPLQLGVIRSFKVAFRRQMLRTLLHEYAAWETTAQQLQPTATVPTPVPAATTTPDKQAGDVRPAFDVHAFTHTRNALQWLQSAWSSASATSIRQAWAKSNYLPAHLLLDLSDDVARPLDSSVYAEFVELLALLSTKRALLSALGLAGIGDTEQVALELISVDDPEAGSGLSNDDVNDDEIVLESLSAQGLLRESQRVSQQGVLLDAAPDVASISDACATVEKLLRFLDKSGNEQVLAATDRRGGRSSLLSLHRILLKARAKERSSTAYTV